MIDVWIWLFCLLMTGIAGFIDQKTGKIPNKITYPMMGIGLLYALILGQYATIFIGVVMLLIGPLIKGFGMGDTKIVAANQFFIGNVFGIPIALYLVIGGLFFRYMGKNPRVGPYFFAVLLNVFVAHTIISAGSV